MVEHSVNDYTCDRHKQPNGKRDFGKPAMFWPAFTVGMHKNADSQNGHKNSQNHMRYENAAVHQCGQAGACKWSPAESRISIQSLVIRQIAGQKDDGNDEC